MSESVTHLDILNYDIAHLIRTETADGHTIAEFLSDVMTRRDKPFTPKKLRIRHTDRMAAAREILRRGFGHFGRKRKLVDDYDANYHDDTNDYDTLHTDLAKRMREYTEHGTDAVRFLLDVMEDANPDEPYTWHHRMSAAHELLRRGWDTNYDHITPEMLQDYWRNQHSPARPANPPKDHPAQSPFPLRGKVRMGVKSPAEGTGVTAYPASNKPLSLRERAGVRVNPTQPLPLPTPPTPPLPAIPAQSLPLAKAGAGIQRLRAQAASTPHPPQQTSVGASGRTPPSRIRPHPPHPFHPCQFPTTTNPTTSSNPSTPTTRRLSTTRCK